MKDEKSIEEIVNNLTEAEQDKVLKANRIGIILMLLTVFAAIIVMLVSVVVFLKTPQAYIYFDKFVVWIISITVCGLGICFSEYFIIKKKVPYYDEKVCGYIKKNRKKMVNNQ